MPDLYKIEILPYYKVIISQLSKIRYNIFYFASLTLTLTLLLDLLYSITMGGSQSRLHSNFSVVPLKKIFMLGIIDVQNDFLKGGSLAVTDANEVIGPINKLRFTYFKEVDTFITMDYHPHDHMSFAKTHNKKEFENVELDLVMPDQELLRGINQTLWPQHCVKDTSGAQLHRDLIVTTRDTIVKKGTLKNVESYSAFGDGYNGKYEITQLDDVLRKKNVTDIILTGIACDYCVYYTALDAIRLGYKVHLILSCTRGVAEDTTKNALLIMKNKGVVIYNTVDDFYNYYSSERTNNFTVI